MYCWPLSILATVAKINNSSLKYVFTHIFWYGTMKVFCCCCLKLVFSLPCVYCTVTGRSEQSVEYRVQTLLLYWYINVRKLANCYSAFLCIRHSGVWWCGYIFSWFSMCQATPVLISSHSLLNWSGSLTIWISMAWLASSVFISLTDAWILFFLCRTGHLGANRITCLSYRKKEPLPRDISWKHGRRNYKIYDWK